MSISSGSAALSTGAKSLIIAVCAAAVAAATPAAAAIFINGSVSAGTEAATFEGAVVASNSNFEQQSADHLSMYGADTTAYSTSSARDDISESLAQAFARAEWNSADAGSLQADWHCGGAGTFDCSVGFSWDYRFKAAQPGQLYMHVQRAFDVYAPDPRPVELLALDNGYETYGNFLQGNKQVDASIPLYAGDYYELKIFQTTGLFSSTPQSLEVADSVQADWSIVASPTPEPATWAMMLCGVGLAGAVLRRRHGALAT